MIDEIIITDSILKNIIDIEISLERFNKLVLTSELKAELSEETGIENLLHLSNILGFSLTLSEAKNIYLGKIITTDELNSENTKNTYQMLINYRRYEEYIGSILDSSIANVDLNSMMHVNKLLLDKIKEEWELKIRTDRSNDELGYLYDLDIEDSGLKLEDLNETLSYVTKYGEIKNPLLIVAYYLFQFIKLTPFEIGNKICTVGLYEYLMKIYGLEAKGFYPTSMFLDEYKHELQRTFIYIVENNDKSNLWYERFIKNYADSIRKRLIDVQTKVAEYETRAKKNNGFLSLNKRQLKILKYLQNIPQVKREDYVHMMEVSTMTAYRDLNELVSKKLLKVSGSGRGTKYMLITK